ncbi:LOW QUALITY PROTEIN: dnaJ homolog subfamily C member 1-like [Saccoglossus kowalevskii]
MFTTMPKLVLFVLVLGMADAWDSEELELFDLVEEIQKNFYDMLGLDSSASQSDIKRAYRKLSLQLHPDKNKEEDAEEKFRQLVAVSEVLKDETQRKREEILSRKRKPKKKKKDSKHSDNGDDDYMDEQMNAIPKPEIKNLLPFQIYRLIIATAKATPESIVFLKDYIISLKNRNQDQIEEDDKSEEDEKRRTKRNTKIHFENVEYKMLENLEPVSYTATKNTDDVEEEFIILLFQKVEWSDDDISLLAKTMAKYPGGTVARWEKIAEEVGRPVNEVSKKAKEIKSSAFAISVQAGTQGITGGVNTLVTSKTGKQIKEDEMTTRFDELQINQQPVTSDLKLKDNEDIGPVQRKHRKVPKRNKSHQKMEEDCKAASKVEVKTWGQDHQKLFEMAIAKFDKNTPERWEKIAAAVPGKTKTEWTASLIGY